MRASIRSSLRGGCLLPRVVQTDGTAGFLLRLCVFRCTDSLKVEQTFFEPLWRLASRVFQEVHNSRSRQRITAVGNQTETGLKKCSFAC